MVNEASDELEAIDWDDRMKPKVLAMRVDLYHAAKNWELMADIAKHMAERLSHGHEEYEEVSSEEAEFAVRKALDLAKRSHTPSEMNLALGAALKADRLYRNANSMADGSVVSVNCFYGSSGSPLRNNGEL
jgi:hypothetical protein